MPNRVPEYCVPGGAWTGSALSPLLWVKRISDWSPAITISPLPF